MIHQCSHSANEQSWLYLLFQRTEKTETDKIQHPTRRVTEKFLSYKALIIRQPKPRQGTLYSVIVLNLDSSNSRKRLQPRWGQVSRTKRLHCEWELSSESQLINSRCKEHSEEVQQGQQTTPWPRLLSYTHLLPFAPLIFHASALKMDLRLQDLFLKMYFLQHITLITYFLPAPLSLTGTAGTHELMMGSFLPWALYMIFEEWGCVWAWRFAATTEVS